MSREVVVVSAVRTAIGTFGGSLASFRPADLGTIVIKEAIARAGLRVDGGWGEWVAPVELVRSIPNDPVDLLVLATKAHDSAEALAPWTTHDGTPVLVLQNGLGGEDAVRDALPHSPVAIGLALFAVSLTGPGRITVTGPNGLTLGGVGSATDIDHVEVYANADDGIEFFGGTVNTSHLVAAFCQDDSFDIDQGYSGTNQFWFAIQDPLLADGIGSFEATSLTFQATLLSLAVLGTSFVIVSAIALRLLATGYKIRH